MKRNPCQPPLPKFIRKKSKAPWVHAWAFPLAAWNFSSQKSWSPFLVWANTPCKEHLTYCTIPNWNYYISWFIMKPKCSCWGVHNSLLVWALVSKVRVHISHSPFFVFFIQNTIANRNLTRLWHPQIKLIGRGSAWPHPPFLEVPLF
jgi:hypothetical protein